MIASPEVDVTIGFPVFNGEGHLAAALDSLLSQSYPHFRLVLSDNASTDATAQICRRYAAQDSRILYRRHSANIGPTMNFNSLLEFATTPYFMWTAHDDEWSPNYVGELRNLLDAEPGAVLAWGDIQERDDFGKETVRRSLAGLGSQTSVFARFASLLLTHEGAGKANACYGLMRSEPVQRTGGLYVGSRHEWGTDNLFLYRLVLHGQFVHTPAAVLYKRNPQARIAVQMDRTPAAVAAIQKARKAQRKIEEDIQALQVQISEGNALKGDVSRQAEYINRLWREVLIHYQASYDFLLDYWPPILEYFENAAAVIEESSLPEPEQAFLKLALHVRCATWLLPLVQENGAISGAQGHLLSETFLGYLALRETLPRPPFREKS